MNKEIYDKFLEWTDELKILDIMKSSVQSMNRIYKAKLKSQERQYNDWRPVPRIWVRWWRNTTVSANCDWLIEQYKNIKEEFDYMYEYFKKITL